MERELWSLSEFSGLDHDERVVAAYLKYGSVDEILRRQEELKIYLSQAGIHRLISKWGIVKAAGPNSKISEAVYFLEQLALEKVPLETLYRKMPPSFQTSVMTLHRILSHVKEGVTRRAATALLITRDGEPNKILVARDISTPRMEYGKFYGAYSLPMGFSKRSEPERDSILRVLQQEVFSRQVVEGTFGGEEIVEKERKVADFEVIDIRLTLYHVILPDEMAGLEKINSYKLTDYQYLSADEIFERRELFRAGVPEMTRIYARGLALGAEELKKEVPVMISELNLALSEAG